MVLFLLNTVMISLRFYFFPKSFKASLLHPTESLFVPACVVSFGTILINISQYGLDGTGQWLNDAVWVMFWINSVLAIVASCAIYLLMYVLLFLEEFAKFNQADDLAFSWSTQTLTLKFMTPAWIFPAYPLLITGPHAGILSSYLRQQRALDIIIGGVVLQGTGFLVAQTVYAAFIYRLMRHKLPKESSRPGMFVSVGPSGFTVSGLITMADSAQRVLPEDFMGDGALAAMILKVSANWVGIWLWGYVFRPPALPELFKCPCHDTNSTKSCDLVLSYLGRGTLLLCKSW